MPRKDRSNEWLGFVPFRKFADVVVAWIYSMLCYQRQIMRRIENISFIIESAIDILRDKY